MGIFWNKVKTSNPKFAQPLPFIQGYSNSPSSLLCIEFGLRGPAATFSGGYLAGVEALMFAYDQIAYSAENSTDKGNGEIMLVGASESLSQAAWAHLLASGQLSTTGDWSHGMIPGEGSAMVVLESEASALKRGARIYAEIEGVNFLPIPTTPNADPMILATDIKETVQFVSIPNTLLNKEWTQPLRPDMATVATKYYTGDMLSVSVVLRTALAAGMLGEKFPLARLAGQAGIPLLFKNCQLGNPRFAIATGYDPYGSLGMVMLRNCKD
jgi:3-oxoacyl-(acyl-carrier-protein) synthase